MGITSKSVVHRPRRPAETSEGSADKKRPGTLTRGPGGARHRDWKELPGRERNGRGITSFPRVSQLLAGAITQ